MNLQYARISELLWLVITGLSLIYAFYVMYTEGWQEWPYLIITFLASLMYFFRRMMRKRFEKDQNP
jgi:hypothetical protein